MTAEEKHKLWLDTKGESGYPELQEGDQVWALVGDGDNIYCKYITVSKINNYGRIDRANMIHNKQTTSFYTGEVFFRMYPSEKSCLEALIQEKQNEIRQIENRITKLKSRILQLSCIALIFLLSQSCVTRKACESKFGVCGFISPVHIEMHDTTVVTEERVRVDTFSVVRNYRTTDTVLIDRLFRTIPRVHSSNNVQMFWLNDSTLAVRSVCKSDTVRIKGATKTVTQVKETVKEVAPAWYYGWKWWLLAGVIGLVFGLILRR